MSAEPTPTSVAAAGVPADEREAFRAWWRENWAEATPQDASVTEAKRCALLAWQARAALAAAPALPSEPAGWRPIEIRPKEMHATYLVADAVRGFVAPWINGVIHNNVGTPHDWHYGEAITHWMPLPPAPAAAQATPAGIAAAMMDAGELPAAQATPEAQACTYPLCACKAPDLRGTKGCEAQATGAPSDAPVKYDPWASLGRWFKTWVGSALYDSGGAEVDLEDPYEAFRMLHAQRAQAPAAAVPPAPVVPAGWRLLKDTTPDDRAWPEDAGHENGCYMNTCAQCLRMFTGHKRRVVCRGCAAPAAAPVVAQAEAAQPSMPAVPRHTVTALQDLQGAALIHLEYLQMSKQDAEVPPVVAPHPLTDGQCNRNFGVPSHWQGYTPRKIFIAGVRYAEREHGIGTQQTSTNSTEDKQ